MGLPGPESSKPCPATLADAPCRFEIYRADEIRATALHFVGGDWHWQLCGANGQVLIDAGGYSNEQACISAITILRDSAAAAEGRMGP